MQTNILEKRRKLKELSEQLHLVQLEVQELETSNPDFIRCIEKLERTKKELEQNIFKTFEVDIPNLVKLTCEWNGVEMWPKVTSWLFMFDEKINCLLERLFITEEVLIELFETEHESVKNACKTLAKYDKEIKLHNQNVMEIYEKHSDEAILSLIIEENPTR